MTNTYLDASTDWPFPVAYGKENEIHADVLVIGGGIAGCHAAISAAKRGAKVAVVEKAAVVRSGNGGAGVDHWHGALTNPCSKITPEEMMQLADKNGPSYTFAEYGNGITSYILFKESYDALMDVESWGIPVRDVNDEFKGAEFRDDDTKLMFAYDYENKWCVRVNGGANIKVAMWREMVRLGVGIYDRIMSTSLLTEGGKQGSAVVGATGINTHTGEFYIFKAKATILATNAPVGLWMFSTELTGSSGTQANADPNNSGDGTAMAWEAGVELALMERSNKGSTAGGFSYPAYGTGNAHNTWYACTMVDANGKTIPWVDREGNVLSTVSDRYRPAPGQRAFLSYGQMGPYEFWGPSLTPDLPERIAKGEFALPLYADLPAMPDQERRALWGLMVGNEGKSRILYTLYQEAGFDPDKDMLQANVMPPDQYTFQPWWNSYGPRQHRGGFLGGGVVFDWDMRSNLDGLFVAGETTYSGGDHATAATNGRYAGRRAAAYVQTVDERVISRSQIEKEMERVYAPVRRKDGMGWKELRLGIVRIMQDYCGEYKNEETLAMGLRWLESIRESEATQAYARNPHELMRTLECLSRITVGEVVMRASLARKSSSVPLDFKRLDYPETDPSEWNVLVTMRMLDGEIAYSDRQLNYYLQGENADSYEENYAIHCGL